MEETVDIHTYIIGRTLYVSTILQLSRRLLIARPWAFNYFAGMRSFLDNKEPPSIESWIAAGDKEGSVRKIRILLIDNNKEDVNLVRSQLLRLSDDLEFVWSDTGEKGLKSTSEFEFDCVLCEYRLPDKDGLEVLRELRESGKNTPFIFLTGQGDETVASEAFHSGANDYFTKEEGFSNSERLLGSIKLEVDKREQEHSRLAIKHQRLVGSMPDLLCFADFDGYLKFVNPAWSGMLGWSEEELLSKPLLDFIHPDDHGSTLETLKLLKRGKPVFDMQNRYLCKDGSFRWIAWNLSPLEKEKTIVATGRDISKRHEQLIQAAKMVSLGTLVSGVAHEINNPNHVVMSNAAVLMEAINDIEPLLERHYREYGDYVIGGLKYSRMRDQLPLIISGIFKGSERIKTIVEELRNFARKQPASPTDTVDINEVVKSAVTLMSNMIKKFTDNFSVQYSKESPLFKGNFQRLEQVIINLLTNACQALPGKDRSISVSIRFDKKRNAMIVKVKDEGEGIPEENLKHVLDPFFTTKREAGGTGLGLSICSTIVDEHGGNLRFSSRQGKGTTATVFIPLGKPQDGASEEVEQ